jgi:chorismate mutase
MRTHAEINEFVWPYASGGADDIDDGPAAQVRSLERDLDWLDLQLLYLIRRRTAVAKNLRRADVEAGGPGYVHHRELAVIRRFNELGPVGRELALLLLRLSRTA